MARFVFEFEAVLEQRRGAERAKKLAVAALERERMDLEARIREIQGGIVREKEDLRDHLFPAGDGVPVDMRTVRLQAGASLRLVGQAHHAAIRLAGALAKLQGVRRELIDATTRRRAVEILREKRLAAWKRAQERREAAALDEINVMTASRKEAGP